MRRIFSCLLPLILLSLVTVTPPALAARGVSPSVRLRRQMAGAWQDTQGRGIRLEIRNTTANGGTIRYTRGKSFVEQSPFRVVGADAIFVTRPKLTYRVTFTRAGMEWRLKGGRGKPRLYRRIVPRSNRGRVQA